MPVTLTADLSFCRVDGHLIFLDLENDRYFQLSQRLESALIAYLDGKDCADDDVNDLIRRNLLTKSSPNTGVPCAAGISSPSHSAIEQRLTVKPLNIPTLLEVFAIVFSTQAQLRTRKLKHIVHNVVAHRQRRISDVETDPVELPVERLLEAAAAFSTTRPYVPIETCCLLDSLSLLKFLSRRRLPAHIVFGVTRAPFAAHCWVQYRNWVLNDTLGNVNAHTPIRAI